MSAPTTIAVLPEADLDFLNEKGWRHDIAPYPGEVRIYIRDFPMPQCLYASAYRPADPLAVRIPAIESGYVLDQARCATDQWRLS